MLTLLLVTDNNIWSDLENGRVLQAIFDLPFRFVTSDFIGVEMPTALSALLRSLDVEFLVLNPDQVADIYTLNQEHRSVSIADLSALILARDLQVILLSGDKALRNLAEANSIKVHGVLWLLDELVNNQVIVPLQAALALEKMLAKNARLPQDECAKRMRKWRGSP